MEEAHPPPGVGGRGGECAGAIVPTGHPAWSSALRCPLAPPRVCGRHAALAPSVSLQGRIRSYPGFVHLPDDLKFYASSAWLLPFASKLLLTSQLSGHRGQDHTMSKASLISRKKWAELYPRHLRMMPSSWVFLFLFQMCVLVFGALCLFKYLRN